YRAAAGVPLVDASGRTVALIMLYSAFPGFFATNRVGKFLGYLQQVLGRDVAMRIHAPVIPLQQRASYRALLREGRVAVLYQPVVDFRDGSPSKVEALARLLDENDELIAADAFIPALGEEDLFELTEVVLARAAHDCRALERDGIRTCVAVNIPAHALGETRYRDAVMRTLHEHGLPPDRLVLEVLETPLDNIEMTVHDTIAAELRAAGVTIVQDDLGSAHSSLVRMDSYPFDGVKIDQTLVRGARSKPQRALEFVLYLTRLAHALNIHVTVEGLEDAALVEAAAILGADRGQGYGIAMPMHVSELPAWFATYRYEVDVQSPRTALGALAGFLLWDLQLGELARWPNLAEQFVGADSLLERYARREAREDATLEQLVERARADARLGAQHDGYRATRSEIVRTLRAHVLDGR
ncbi:MAG: EAL domain-containing protein, partial [bacterium]|nr:EAL domain-containing protein [bacterium]